MSRRYTLPTVCASFALCSCAQLVYTQSSRPTAVLSRELTGVEERVLRNERTVARDIAVDGGHLRFALHADAACTEERISTYVVQERHELYFARPSGGDADGAVLTAALIELGIGAAVLSASILCWAECGGADRRTDREAQSERDVGLFLAAVPAGIVALFGVLDLGAAAGRGYETIESSTEIERVTGEPYACPNGPLPNTKGTVALDDARVGFVTDEHGFATVPLQPLREAYVPGLPIELVVQTEAERIAVVLDEAQTRALADGFAPRPSLRDHVVAALPIEMNGVAGTSGDEALWQILAAELGQRGLRLVPSSRIRTALLQEKASSYRECVDEACQIELGRAVAATVVLRTTVSALDDTCTVASVAFDLRTETTLHGAASDVACNAKAIRGALATIGRRLAD